jgi:biopolymer transport protein TolR
LLIIFMVVTPMLSSGVDVKLPRAATANETNDAGQHIVISIREDGAVFVDTKRSSDDTLIDDINAEFKKDAERSSLIKGDRNLTWEVVHNVMDIINEGGMNTMLLATEDKE